MPGLCTHVGARVGALNRISSPSQLYNKTITAEEKSKLSNESKFNNILPDSETGNRVMVVVDSTPEAKVAIDWALSNTLLNQDTIILLHVVKHDGKTNGELHQRGYDLLRSTKYTCQLKRPEVRVEMALREGHDKGSTIVEEARRMKVSLLVLGHGKQSWWWRLRMMWTRKRASSRIVDYCIQNANCMTIAVRKKQRKYGGYLITTKNHKKFWLLA